MTMLPPGWTPQGPVLWSYRVVQVSGPAGALEMQMNAIGADGWELVSTWLYGAQATTVSNGTVVAVFKRPYVGQVR